MTDCEWCGSKMWDRDHERLRWPWPTPHGIWVCRTCRDLLLACMGYERRNVRRTSR